MEIVDVMFKTNPGDEGRAEGEVEKSFVGDGEDDENWRERQEYYYQSMEIVVVRLKPMQEGHSERCNYQTLLAGDIDAGILFYT